MCHRSISLCFVTLVLAEICTGGKTPSGLYHDGGDGHTILTQKFSKKDVREISYDILNIMGFQHRPHPHLVDTHSPASQFLLEVYNSLTGGEHESVDLSNTGKWQGQRAGSRPGHNLTWSQFNVDREEVKAIKVADAIISFTNRGHRFSDRLVSYEEEKQLWFDVSEVSEQDLVLGVELRVWKKTGVQKRKKGTDEDVFGGDVIRISVKQILPGQDEKTFEERELDEIVTAKWEQGWLRLNVTAAFRAWTAQPTSNYGLVLSTKRADTGEEISMGQAGLATILDIEDHQPFLVSFLKSSDTPRQAHPPKPPRRAPRSTGGNSREGGGKRNRKTKKGRNFAFAELLDNKRSCQMGMLYVNFEDLGWKDWVIAPDGFIAYYCTGECSFPLTAIMNATNHAIVSTLVHTYYPLEYPKPSCAPVKLGSISMLYYDDNSNVTVKKYKDMVIKSCGCK